MSQKWQWSTEDQAKHGGRRYQPLSLYELPYDSYDSHKVDKQFTLKHFEKDLKLGGRDKSTKEAARVLLGDKDTEDSRFFKRGLNPYAKEFTFKLKPKKSSRRSRRVSRKSTRKSRRVSRKASRKSRRVSRKSTRKSRRVSRKSRRVSSRKSRSGKRSVKVLLKSTQSSKRKSSRKSTRRSGRKSRMGKRERSCKDLLKEKIGVNIGEYKEGRYSSRQQAIAVAYNQVKKMKPSCEKYLKKKS